MSEHTDVAEVAAATARVLEGATAVDLSVPSRCPGWSRGHVLTHLARNADGLARLARWAADGTERPQYATAEGRAADIAAGSTRPLPEQLADLRDSAAGLAEAFAALDDDEWDARVRMGVAAQGPRVPARELPWRRLVELEVHHVDLDLPTYTPAQWQRDFVARLIGLSARKLRKDPEAPAMLLLADDFGVREVVGEGGPTVAGPGAALAVWLAGRGTGDGLEVTPDGPLPRLGAWG